MTAAEPPLRGLPQVDRLIEALDPGDPHPLRAAAARRAIDDARQAARAGAPVPDLAALAAAAGAFLRQGRRHRLVPVINASGVLLHTNLGRAPLSPRALAAVDAVGRGYSNLEFDLAEGRRGSRYDHARDLLMRLTGAEAALVVNNNAGAVLLTLAALARGREVIISRGELIEIGGEFRIPEILEASGARLREVGTTNRTHLKDYRNALSPDTGAILKVHPSNYAVVGFVKSVPGPELAALAREAGVPLVHDVGSGLLRRRVAGVEPAWLAGEPSVEEALAEGAGVVTFSGDKLLGGPQAGLIVGNAGLIAAMGRSPLLRTYRVDKTTLAALEATLLTYLDGGESTIPFWSMALAAADGIGARAEALAARLEGAPAAVSVSVVPGFSTTGGGSAPTSQIPTMLLQVVPASGSVAAAWRAALVDAEPPVIARVEDDRLLVDLRTVPPEQDGVLGAILAGVLCPRPA